MKNPTIYADHKPNVATDSLSVEQPTADGKSAAALPPFPDRYREKFLRYQESGFNVVPVQIDYINGKKCPTFPASWKANTFTYADCKTNHNGLFIVTGSASKLMVVDFDPKGEELDIQLRKFGIDLREYSHCWTPRGVHIYLSDEHREYWLTRFGRRTLTTTNPALGIDIRHDNAGVFAPGTEIPGYGKYTWVIPPYDPQALAYDVQKLTPLMDAIFAPLGVEKMRKALPARATPTHYEDDYARAEYIVSILAAIKIAYLDWVKIGQALYAGFGERGKPLWDYFLDNPHYKESINNLNVHWYSFRNTHSVTLASLFYVAKIYGVRYE